MQLGIDQYVLATRRLTRNPLDPRLHDVLFRAVLFGCGSAAVHEITLKVIDSTSRRCELVVIDDQPFLLLDQSLGSCFLSLEQAIAQPQPSRSALSCTYRWMAQELQICGRTDFALAFATAYRDLVATLPSPPPTSNQGLRRQALVGLVQECFVIAHELYHYAFRAEPCRLQEPLALIRSILLEALANRRHDARQLIDGDDRCLIDEYYDRSRSLIASQDDFVQEVLCDDLGALLTVHTMSQLTDFGVDELLEIVFRAIHHLRLLGAIRVFATWLDSRHVREVYFLETAIRLACFRDLRSARDLDIADDGITRSEKAAKRRHALFSRINEQYYERVQDPALDGLMRKMRQIVRGSEAPWYSGPIEELSLQNRRIDELCGGGIHGTR